MAFAKLLNHLQISHPQICGRAKSEWGSQHAQHRKAIRESLMHELSEDEGILDLKCRPESERWSISISHTSDYGGWLASPLPITIGLDIETLARINEAVIQRVCSPQEIAACPDPRFLWAAKESLFKALGQAQPKIISSLEISDWKRASEIWMWSGEYPCRGLGVLISSPPHIFSACLVTSSVSNGDT